MTQAEEMFENAILHWRDAKGKGTALIPKPLDDRVMILGVLQRIYSRSPTSRTIIVTNTFNERQTIIEFLTHQEDEDNNTEFKKLINDKYIKIFTIDFLLKNTGCFRPNLIVLYHIESVNEPLIYNIKLSVFNLVILNKLLSSQEMFELYKLAPMLEDFKHNEIEELRLSTPVEETQIGISIDENSEDNNLHNRYNEYISTTFSIFGSFDIMQQARLGNPQLNISANQICATIAQENGWHDRLDMSIDFNRQIDALYNPINLKERATQTYEIIRLRSQLLSDYNDKLETILDIVQKHHNEKILIINKRGDFANLVTTYLNTNSENAICGNYHDKVENIPAIDDDGNPIYYKSGAKKGERKYMASQAQKTYNEKAFNANKLNVLSVNNTPDKELSVDVDVVIITSPQCECLKSYMYRLSNVSFNRNKLILYTLYIKNSIEERMLADKERTKNHVIFNNYKNDDISVEYSDFVVAD